jgi:hypothetical protein
MPEQPYLFGSDSSPWIPIKDGDVTGMSLFMRHYMARERRKVFQFVGPGEKEVLITRDARALFVWRKFISDAGETGVNCAVFRNERSDAGKSSELIAEANTIARRRWPGERLYTYVDPTKVRSRNPGYCFLLAGYRKCGMTKSGKLVLELL